MRNRLPSIQPVLVPFRVPFEGRLVPAAVSVCWPRGARTPLLEFRVREEALCGMDACIPSP